MKAQIHHVLKIHTPPKVMKSWRAPMFPTIFLLGTLRLATKGLQGDLEYFAQGYGLETPNSSTPCPYCAANMSTHPWTDVRPGALWRTTLYCQIDHEEWLSKHPKACGLFKVPGISISIVRGDLMHVKHFGVDCYLLGSFCAYICQHKLPGTENDNMSYLWKKIKAMYKDCTTRKKRNKNNIKMKMHNTRLQRLQREEGVVLMHFEQKRDTIKDMLWFWQSFAVWKGENCRISVDEQLHTLTEWCGIPGVDVIRKK